MRVTNLMTANQAIKYINQNQERLNELNIMGATNKQFQNVSDDPTRAMAAMTIKSSIQTGQNYQSTAQDVSSWMSVTDQAFSKISSVLIKAISNVQKGLTDTLSAEERLNSLAPEMDTMLEEMMDLANSSYMDKYIFSGYQINTKPFSVSASNPDVIDYNGDSGLMKQDIGTGQTITMNINNSSVIGGIFSAITRARNALQANDMTELNASLTDLNNSVNGIADLTATNGARMRQVESVVDHLANTNLTLKSLLSQKEDANMAEVAVMLTNQETTYQAVLEVGKRAISALSLFDLL